VPRIEMRMTRRRGSEALLALLLPCLPGVARAEEPAAVVRAVRPDRQAGAVIGLFDGSKAPSPAAAMAAWRRATGDADGLPKVLQAIAALFNPETAEEWRAFRDAELAATLDADGRPRWSAVVPHDDGSLAALVTSFRLSGGSDDPPLGDPPAAVARLGGPDAAVASVTPRGTAFAGRREDLADALSRLARPASEIPQPDLLPIGPEDSGFRLAFEPARLPADLRGVPNLLRLAEAARATGAERIVGFASLRDDHLDLEFASRFGASTPAPVLRTPSIDPAWFDFMPADATQAAAAFAVGREPAFVDAMFDVVDRIDRADPARAGLQPLRVRLNLLATLRGVRLEADLWPKLRGVGAAAFADPGRPGSTAGAIVALHADGPDEAEAILAKVAAPALGSLVRDGTLALARRGSTVLVAWGPHALDVALKSAEAPGSSIAGLVGEGGAGAREVGRAGLFWPGRVRLSGINDDPASPLAATLAEAAPVAWRGGWDDGRAWDVIRWGDLRRPVARFLERVPQAPPEVP